MMMNGKAYYYPYPNILKGDARRKTTMDGHGYGIPRYWYTMDYSSQQQQQTLTSIRASFFRKRARAFPPFPALPTFLSCVYNIVRKMFPTINTHHPAPRANGHMTKLHSATATFTPRKE